MNIIILLGPPGVGKGTVSEVLSNYGIKHVSTGDMLRKEIKNNTDLGKRSHKKISQGLFADDDDVMNMVTRFLLNKKKDDFIIFDGFPRTIIQADKLEELTKNSNVKIYNVLRLLCPENILISRLSGRRTCVVCGAVYHDIFSPSKVFGRCDIEDGSLAKRLDDEPIVIKRRLKIYNKLTKPLAEYYKNKSMLSELNANCPPDEVRKQTLDLYKEILK